MTRRSINLVQFWLTVVFFGIPPLAFALAGALRFWSQPGVVDVQVYTGWVVITTVIWALVLDQQRVNRIETLVTLQTGIKTIARATVWSMAIVLMLAFFYREVSMSRVFVVTGFFCTFLMSVAVLHLFRSGLFGRNGRGVAMLRIAIVGADARAKHTAEHLNARSLLHCQVVCFVALPGQQPEVGLDHVVPWERIEDAVDLYRCQEVLIALPPTRFVELQPVTERVKHLCVPARIVLDLGEGMFVPEHLFDFWGLPLLDVGTYPVDTVRYAVGKRLFDIAFSALACIFLAPLMLCIAAAIKFTSPGPVFFRQERISLNGRKFLMLKFRTMCVQDANSSSSLHTSRDDSRITPIGRFLRRTSLDELPQFFNVLKGDMSVVGPRPELTFFVQKFRNEIPTYMARHNVKCGITGWAQINGLRGSDTSIPERIRYDLYYMKNWSMAFDFKIIFLTILNGFAARNAY